MKFSYTALSNDNQKLTGIMEADSPENAKNELHKMDLSIVDIDEISDREFELQKQKEINKKTKEGIKTFIFTANDPFEKEITGTIDSKDSFSAYSRLVSEYNFNVKELYPSHSDDIKKEEFKKLKEEWDKKLEEEGIEQKNIKTAYVKGELEDITDTVDKKIIEEIDNFIINTKKVLSEEGGQFSIPFLKQIEKTLAELEHIRTSNNIKHISEVCNQLYELISHPDKINDDEFNEENADATYKGVLSSMQKSGFVQKEFYSHTKAAEVSNVYKIFDKIIKKIKLKSKSQLSVPKNYREKNKSKTRISKLIDDFLKNNKKIKKLHFIEVARKFILYLTSPNAILRQSRKHELIKEYETWLSIRSAAKVEKEARIAREMKEAESKGIEKLTFRDFFRRDFSAFFLELDSFTGWLLFFYISYFFLVDFGLEKSVGLPKDFILKTLNSPLIFHITVFLFFLHFIIKVKLSFFKNNFPGSVFLFLFGFGFYSVLIINF